MSFSRTAKAVICALGMGALTDALPRARAQPDAAAILSKYEMALEGLRRVEYNAHVVMYEKKADGSERLRSDMRYAWRRNGGLAKVSFEGKIWDPRSEGVYERKSILLLDPRHDRTNVDWRDDGTVAVLMDRNPSAAQRRHVFGVAAFTLMHGYVALTGVPYLPDLLRKSRLVARDEFLDQRQVVLLEATGRHGRVRLWCDPAMDFWPRRLEWQLAATDVLEDTNNESVQEKTLTRLGLEAITVSVGDWDFARVSDRWVPTSFTEQRTTKPTDNRPGVVRRTVCTVSDHSIAPGHLDDPASFELGTDVPNGTRVHVASEQQIEYVWQDGTVVKRIDADPTTLEGHRLSGTGLPKSLIALGVIAAGMIVLLLVVWRWRSVRS